MGRDRWPKTVREVALSHWPLRACGARRGRPAAQRTIPRRDWPRSSPHLRTVLSSEGTADTRSSHRPEHSGRTRELLPLVSGASAEDTFAAFLWPVPAQEDTFLVNHDEAHYQIQTLGLLVLHAPNVVRTYPGIKMTADELIVPSHSSRHEAVLWWAVQFLRQTFLRQSSAASDQKKLFLDRGAAKRITILNQREVLKYLSGRGYTILDTAKLSFQEQVSLFRGARSIVSWHGAGLANLCFAEPGTRP